MKYADIARLRAMDREGVLALLAKLHEPDWMLELDSTTPEEFARAMVREGQARAADSSGVDVNPLLLLFDIAQLLS